jgi:hypothetical protein
MWHEHSHLRLRAATVGRVCVRVARAPQWPCVCPCHVGPIQTAQKALSIHTLTITCIHTQTHMHMNQVLSVLFQCLTRASPVTSVCVCGCVRWRCVRPASHIYTCIYAGPHTHTHSVHTHIPCVGVDGEELRVCAACHMHEFM